MKQWLILQRTPWPRVDFWSLVLIGAWWAWVLWQGNVWLILFGFFIFSRIRPTTIFTPKWLLLWGIHDGIYSLHGLSKYRMTRTGL